MIRKCLIGLFIAFLFRSVQAQETKLVLPIGHTDNILSASFSPDGKKVVTASWDNTAKVWDAEKGVLLLDLKGHSKWVLSALFSPDGKKIVSCSDDSTAKVWDAEKGTLLLDLKKHTNIVHSAEFSPDGKKIVTASWDSTAKVWNAEKGSLLLDLKKHISYSIATQFSSDGKKIVTFSIDHTAKVWDAENGTLLFDLKGHNRLVNSAKFSLDSKKIITTSIDTTAKVWDAKNGTFLFELKGSRDGFAFAQFSPDGKKIITASWDNTAKVWDAEKGTHLFDLKEHTSYIYTAQFSPDGKKIVTSSDDQTAKVWDAENGSLLFDLIGHNLYVKSAQFSSDGNKILTVSSTVVKIWDSKKGTLLLDLKGRSYSILSAMFSPDGKRIVTASYYQPFKVWDVEKSTLVFDLKHQNSYGPGREIKSAQFSSDSKKIITTSDDSIVKVWDAGNGTFLFDLNGRSSSVNSAQFSPDSKKIVTVSDSIAQVWDTERKTVLLDLKGHTSRVTSAHFSPNGKKIVTTSIDATAKVWDSEKGTLLLNLKEHSFWVNSANFSPDGKKIITGSDDATAKVWDSEKGTMLLDISEPINPVTFAQFSPDGKKVVTASWDNIVKVWDAEKGTPLLNLIGHNNSISSAQFSMDGKKILTASKDNTSKIWDAKTGKLLYTFFAVDSSDYLIVDKDYHYDGTPGARKLLYFTCGSEIIDLEQVKESLWVPDLAERINKGESINNPKLSELNLCGLTPVITSDEKQGDSYFFNIKPGRGGLGETHLLINGNVTKKYRPDQLKKTKEGYQLIIPKQELEPYFIKGQENPIIVKSYTSSNDIFSRGGARKIENKDKVILPPNLYAVVVGISNYKGKELQLNYASKDAQDIGNTLSLACKKLLNTDGKQHVFVYNFNTGQERYNYPEKLNIKNIFDTIASKATANDILLIFFAGHGVVEGKDKKQFYLLTSEASSISDVANTGISTRELIEWIRPEKIKAQKRILILDACNSAEAINELAKNTEFIAVRNTSASDEKKEIERLNDQAGMFVLSASSTNQSAYELGRYSQGLLTYTLLKAIKQQPDILEDKKYLNLSRWFNAAKRSVNEIMNGMGNMGRQDPQVIANTNFNIGIVDQEVVDKIKLADEKPIFSRSEFRNTDNHNLDNLKLRSLVDRQLNDVSRGNTSQIFFQENYEGSEAYSFNGDYKINGNDITISIFLIKGGTEIINKVAWQLKGKTDQLELLADQIVKKGIENVEKK